MTDKQLIRVARDVRKGILGTRLPALMCMAVSAPLQGLLSFYGVETELVTADFPHCNHVWLRLNDGRILDATADQFDGMPPVYLGSMPAQYQRWLEETTP